MISSLLLSLVFPFAAAGEVVRIIIISLSISHERLPIPAQCWLPFNFISWHYLTVILSNLWLLSGDIPAEPSQANLVGTLRANLEYGHRLAETVLTARKMWQTDCHPNLLDTWLLLRCIKIGMPFGTPRFVLDSWRWSLENQICKTWRTWICHDTNVSTGRSDHLKW